MMKNIKIEISYDGTAYSGFQIQPNARTIQQELEKAIYQLTNEEIKIIGSGRTDAGVHAKRQVCNFKTTSSIPIDRWKLALNSVLPEDIVVNHAEEVSDNFHSRFGVKEKTYRYTVDNALIPDVFSRNTAWHIPYSLDIAKMQEASRFFLGEHDYSAYASTKTEVIDKQREIYHFNIWSEGQFIYFQVTGNGFLYNMVRIMVGTLVEIGSNKRDQQAIPDLLLSKSRIKAGITAPAKGLMLWNVKY